MTNELDRIKILLRCKIQIVSGASPIQQVEDNLLLQELCRKYNLVPDEERHWEITNAISQEIDELQRLRHRGRSSF